MTPVYALFPQIPFLSGNLGYRGLQSTSIFGKVQYVLHRGNVSLKADTGSLG